MSAQPLRFHLIGTSCRITGHEGRLTPGQSHMLALLLGAYLTHSVATVEDLVAAVADTGGRAPHKNTIETTIAALRGLLGSDRVPKRAGRGYDFHPQPGDRIDVADLLEIEAAIDHGLAAQSMDKRLVDELLATGTDAPIHEFRAFRSREPDDFESALATRFRDLDHQLSRLRDRLRQARRQSSADTICLGLLCQRSEQSDLLTSIGAAANRLGWSVEPTCVTSRLNHETVDDLISRSDFLALDFSEFGETSLVATLAEAAGTAVIVVHPGERTPALPGVAANIFPDDHDVDDEGTLAKVLQRIADQAEGRTSFNRNRRRLMRRLDQIASAHGAGVQGPDSALTQLTSGYLSSFITSLSGPSNDGKLLVDTDRYEECFNALTQRRRTAPDDIVGVVDLSGEEWPDGFWADAPAWLVAGVAKRVFVVSLDQLLDSRQFARIVFDIRRHARRGRELNADYHALLSVKPLADDLPPNPAPGAVGAGILVLPRDRMISTNVIVDGALKRLFLDVLPDHLDRALAYTEAFSARGVAVDAEQASDLRAALLDASGGTDWQTMFKSPKRGAYERALRVWVPDYGHLIESCAMEVAHAAYHQHFRIGRRPVDLIGLGSGSGSLARAVIQRVEAMTTALLSPGSGPVVGEHHSVDISKRRSDFAARELADLCDGNLFGEQVEFLTGDVAAGPKRLEGAPNIWRTRRPDVVYSAWILHDLVNGVRSAESVADGLTTLRSWGAEHSSLVIAGPFVAFDEHPLDLWARRLRSLGLPASLIDSSLAAPESQSLATPFPLESLVEATRILGLEISVRDVARATAMRVATIKPPHVSRAAGAARPT